MSKGTLNQVTLIGNLGADPEAKKSANGTSAANLRVATTYSYKNVSGEWIDQVEWHRVVVFGKRAEFIGEYANKGVKVAVTGRLHTRKWAKDGIDQYTTEVVADDVQILDKKPSDQPIDADRGSDIPF